MRPDMVPGATLRDYELPDHENGVRRLSRRQQATTDDPAHCEGPRPKHDRAGRPPARPRTAPHADIAAPARPPGELPR